MPRNLDITALRSFVAVVDSDGVTRAAGYLNLTQSAVSMQIKRLEDMLDQPLFDRVGRGLSLTNSGEQLLSYARRMIALNDEAWGRLTCTSFEGTVVLGVPHDIVYPIIPDVLKNFATSFPRMRVQLTSGFTRDLRTGFTRGEIDLVLATENQCVHDGETLAEIPLVWVGAHGGQAWRQRPLRLAFEERCIFRPDATNALDQAGILWEYAVSATQTQVIEATIIADLAVHARLEGTSLHNMALIPKTAGLPELPTKQINMYLRTTNQTEPLLALAEMIRAGYRNQECARMAYKPDSVRSVTAAE